METRRLQLILGETSWLGGVRVSKFPLNLSLLLMPKAGHKGLLFLSRGKAGKALPHQPQSHHPRSCRGRRLATDPVRWAGLAGGGALGPWKYGFFLLPNGGPRTPGRS